MGNLKNAAFLLAALAGAGWLTGAVANARPTHAVTVAVNNTPERSCRSTKNAYEKLTSAEADISGVLADFSPSDSIYPKLKESNRQIVDAIATVRDRLERLHCR